MHRWNRDWDAWLEPARKILVRAAPANVWVRRLEGMLNPRMRRQAILEILLWLLRWIWPWLVKGGWAGGKAWTHLRKEIRAEPAGLGIRLRPKNTDADPSWTLTLGDIRAPLALADSAPVAKGEGRVRRPSPWDRAPIWGFFWNKKF